MVGSSQRGGYCGGLGWMLARNNKSIMPDIYGKKRLFKQPFHLLKLYNMSKSVCSLRLFFTFIFFCTVSRSACQSATINCQIRFLWNSEEKNYVGDIFIWSTWFIVQWEFRSGHWTQFISSICENGHLKTHAVDVLETLSWNLVESFCCVQCLIIGGGPCGLRTAIELALLGCKVVLIEKRDTFSRNNVLHLWPFTIHDLRGLGAKKFYGKFCAGSIDHISEYQPVRWLLGSFVTASRRL